MPHYTTETLVSGAKDIGGISTPQTECQMPVQHSTDNSL